MAETETLSLVTSGSTGSTGSAKTLAANDHEGSPKKLKFEPDASPKADSQVLHLIHSLSHSEDMSYTTSELDNDSNEAIAITEPSDQTTSETIATISLLDHHLEDLSIEQIKSSSLLVATERNIDSGEKITHILQPEDSPRAGTSNVDASSSDQPEALPTTPPISHPHQRTIRFRSRVRITSGVGKNHTRHARRNSSDVGSASDAPSRAHLRSLSSLSADWGGILPSEVDSPQDSSVSVATSRSSSISSSISAPIRFREDESPSSGRPSKWGPLGRRVQLFVGQQRAAKLRAQSVNGHANGANGKRVVLLYDPETRSYIPRVSSPESSGESHTTCSEESPLLGGFRRGYRSYRPRRFSNSNSNSSRRGSYDSYDGRYDGESDWGSDGETRLNQEIEKVFGKWPGRLLNRHWWWWHLEPILCCRQMEDSDFED